MRRPTVRVRLLLPFLALAAAVPLPARPMALADMFRLHRVSDPQLSPDGSQVAFVVADPDLAENYTNSDIWLVSTVGGEPRKLTNSSRQDRHPRWSPDGQWLAFESNRDGDFQIWAVPATGGEARKLTSIATEATQPVWSPDGRAIAFVSAVFPEFSARPFAESDRLNRQKLDAAEHGKVKARVIDHLLYRHWNEWVEGKRQHIFVQQVKHGLAAGGADGLVGGEPRDVTPGDNDGVPTSSTFTEGDEFAFSPDGGTLVFTAPPVPLREQAWSTNHEVYAVNLATGERKQLTTNPAADCTPSFSPDGKMLAYRAQVRAGYEGDRWQLMVLDLATGERRSLTAGLDRSVHEYVWAPDGSRLYFCSADQGGTTVWSVDLQGHAERVLVGGTNSEVAIAGDGSGLVYTHARLDQPPEVMYWRPMHGAPVALTHMNDTLLREIELAAPESVMVAGAGGTSVQMWIIKPPGFDPAKKYPLVFWVHGGPQGNWGNGWSTRWNPEIWAAQGYVVALPNPRGSTGFGQAYTDEISRHWNGKVMDDLFACLAHMEKQPWIDATRMAAAGGSYGGYVMNWFEGHTDKFRCLVNHDGTYNFDSMYGTTEELWFAEWDTGKPWEATAAERAASPHLYAANFKTPMLVIQGERDFRVPMSEGMQVFTALQRQGVPSKLLLFPDEGHWVLKPANSEFWHQTIFSWLAEYLKK
ncbi:MAG TPA: S9 family peptidase [Lacunisphaera sp.]|nr:S9 family peptidase [Lacunisphaera sp.]